MAFAQPYGNRTFRIQCDMQAEFYSTKTSPKWHIPYAPSAHLEVFSNPHYEAMDKCEHRTLLAKPEQ